MKIELKKIEFSERMSQETNCFVADLYINGKKVGFANNEGHGGPTDYHGITPEDNKLIKEAEAYCKTLPNIKSEEFKFEYPNSLENTIDELLGAYLLEKEAKKKEKAYLKAICFGVPNGHSYRTVYWKGRTLSQIPLPNLQKAVDDVRKQLKAGEVIFNTNLAKLGVI